MTGYQHIRNKKGPRKPKNLRPYLECVIDEILSNTNGFFPPFSSLKNE